MVNFKYYVGLLGKQLYQVIMVMGSKLSNELNLSAAGKLVLMKSFNSSLVGKFMSDFANSKRPVLREPLLIKREIPINYLLDRKILVLECKISFSMKMHTFILDCG